MPSRRSPGPRSGDVPATHGLPARGRRVAASVAIASLVVIAATDLLTELGFAHGTLYLVSVLAAAAAQRRALLWGVAGTAVALSLAGALVSPSAATGIPDFAAANRGVSVLMLLTTALLAERLVGALGREREAHAEAARADSARRRDARLLAIAGEATKLGGWSVDVQRGVIHWSDIVARLHGKPPGFSPTLDEAIGFYHPDDRPAVREAVERCIADGTSFDFIARLAGSRGVERWVRAIGHAVRDASGKVVAFEGAFQDVSADHELERRSEMLSATLEQISDAFVLLDQDWRMLFLNERAEQILGRRRSSLEGGIAWEMFPEAIGSVFEGHARAARASGTARTFETYYEPLDVWVEVRLHPVRDGLAVYFQDIGERKRMDERVRTSQRLESVGQLTGGIAHDFNNLLTVVGGNAELLQERLADDGHGRRLAGMIAEAASRGAALTRSMLAFARRQTLEPRPTDVAELLTDLEPLLRRSVGEAIDVRIEVARDSWRTEVDPAQLESALLNLVLNARDAMPSGGRLTIEIGATTLDEEDERARIEAAPGDYVVVSVSDTGVGIDPEDLPRVFEPFFTTKPAGTGSGLGLAMVYGFAKQSGGFATVYSEVAQGTTVRIYLPRATSEAEPAQRRDDTAPLTGGHERVLVVEDDALVRAFAVDQLRALGYDVLEASDAAAALSLLARERVDLLFTDVVMPGGMSGKALADAATASDPTLRVLYASGYTEDAIVHHGRLDAGVALLHKPYRRGELASRVREVLDARSGAADGSG